jgi:transcriptional regulator with XRE-family HTH domain
MLRRASSYHELVDELRRWRAGHGISVRELSLRIGVADSLASRWECDDKRPSLFLAVCWAEAIGARLAVVPSSRRRRSCPRQLNLPW